MSPAGDGTAGFTLVELLIVLVVLSLLAGIGFPALGRARDQLAVAAAARMVVSEVKRARARAVLQRQVTRLEFISSVGRVGVAEESEGSPLGPDLWIELLDAKGQRVTNSPVLQFSPEGGSSGGTVRLSRGDAVALITVDPLLARAVVR